MDDLIARLRALTEDLVEEPWIEEQGKLRALIPTIQGAMAQSRAHFLISRLENIVIAQRALKQVIKEFDQ